MLPAGWLEICGFAHGVRMNAALRSAIVNVGLAPGSHVRRAGESHGSPGLSHSPACMVRRQIAAGAPLVVGAVSQRVRARHLLGRGPGRACAQSLRDMYSYTRCVSGRSSTTSVRVSPGNFWASAKTWRRVQIAESCAQLASDHNLPHATAAAQRHRWRQRGRGALSRPSTSRTGTQSATHDGGRRNSQCVTEAAVCDRRRPCLRLSCRTCCPVSIHDRVHVVLLYPTTRT